jgi:hypothetical protein
MFPHRLVLAAAVALGCRQEARAPPPGDAAPDLAPGPLPTGTASPPSCRDLTYPIPFERRSADVLILFDRSGSMTTELGTGTRYSVAAELLSALVAIYQDKLRFGFQRFPARDGCGAGPAPGCCAEPPQVPVALNQGLLVGDALAAAAPVSGATPTAGALRLAREYYQQLEPDGADRYVLLCTDGRPSCSAGGRPAEPDVYDQNGQRVAGACQDALVEVRALVAAGVKVIVLGIGPGLANDPAATPACLEELAQEGGMPRSEGRPWFFSALAPESLEAALQQIFGGVSRPLCEIDLGRPPGNPDRVAVFLDGREIPRDPVQGWSYASSDPGHIVINGEYCRRLQRFQVSQIDVRGGCPPCVDQARCE